MIHKQKYIMKSNTRDKIETMIKNALLTKNRLLDFENEAQFVSVSPGRYVLSFNVEIPDFIYYTKEHWEIIANRMAKDCYEYTRDVLEILNNTDVQEQMILEEYEMEEEDYEENVTDL